MDNSQRIIILVVIVFFMTLVYLWQKRRNKKHSRHLESAILDAASIPSFHNSIGHLNKELSRARRSHRPLSIIVIEYHPTVSGSYISRQSDDSKSLKITSHRGETDMTEFFLCGKVIRDALRDIDITSYAAVNNQFIIVLPESTKSEAEDALRRIKRLAGRGANQFLAEVAEFPNDGLILDDLVLHAANLISNRDDDTITEW